LKKVSNLQINYFNLKILELFEYYITFIFFLIKKVFIDLVDSFIFFFIKKLINFYQNSYFKFDFFLRIGFLQYINTKYHLLGKQMQKDSIFRILYKIGVNNYYYNYKDTFINKKVYFSKFIKLLFYKNILINSYSIKNNNKLEFNVITNITFMHKKIKQGLHFLNISNPN